MSANPRTFAVLAADKIGQDNKQWIEVMPTCTEAKNGPWLFTITRADLETYAASIQAKPGTIPVDYDHDGARPEGSTRAAGWLTGQARVTDTDRGPILEAEVQWTPAGAEAIRNGDFKMISPEFDFQTKDAKSGLLSKAKAIIAATLTNRPFFRQLTPVAADLDNDTRDALAAALGLDPADVIRLAQWTPSYIDALPATAFLHERLFPFRDADGNVDLPHLRNALARIPTSDLPADVKQRLTNQAHKLLINTDGGSTAKEETDMSDTLKALAVELGLPEDATEEQVTEATKAMKAKADETETVKAELDKLKAAAGDKTELDKLRDELNTEKKLRLDEKRDAILAKAVEDGRFDPATSQVLAKQFDDNIDGLEAVVATYEKKPRRAHGTGGSGEGTDDKQVVKAAKEFEIDDGIKTITAGEGELDTHVKAMKILADRDKHDHTPEEYAAAYAEAELAVA